MVNGKVRDPEIPCPERDKETTPVTFPTTVATDVPLCRTCRHVGQTSCFLSGTRTCVGCVRILHCSSLVKTWSTLRQGSIPVPIPVTVIVTVTGLCPAACAPDTRCCPASFQAARANGLPLSVWMQSRTSPERRLSSPLTAIVCSVASDGV